MAEMPRMIASQAEDRQIERQRRIMGDVERQHIAAILGHLLFERTRQAGRRRGFLALGLGVTYGFIRCAGPPRGLRRSVIGFEQARLTILAQHKEGADIGPVLVRDQQIGVGDRSRRPQASPRH